MPAQFFFRGKMFSSENSYSPSDDSFLLAQAITKAIGTCIDMGCGCGIQALNLLNNGAQRVICVDISKKALATSEANCRLAGFAAQVETRKSDLFENVEEIADVIVFNPPYVESEALEEKDLDGGMKGREVLDRFLEQMPQHLDKKGVCYFLQTDINGYAETKKMLGKLGFSCEIVATKKGFFEELAVFRAEKLQNGK